jgi:hypothetical protein
LAIYGKIKNVPDQQTSSKLPKNIQFPIGATEMIKVH